MRMERDPRRDDSCGSGDRSPPADSRASCEDRSPPVMSRPSSAADDHHVTMLTPMQPMAHSPHLNYPDDRQFVYHVDGKHVEFVRQDDLPPGTVSVVVSGHQQSSAAGGYLQPATTVLVLSELVDDLPQFRASSSGVTGKTTNGLTGVEVHAPPPGDLHGLFLHGPLKREPEDLSHHRKSPVDNKPRHNQKVVLVTPNGEDLVVDVVNNNHSIKDEVGASPRSLNGTPTSTGLSDGPIELIGDGLKGSMSYSGQMFSPMAAPHSGTPSPIPYSEHAGYTPAGQLGTSYITASSALRGGGGSAGSAFAMSDPYYREYFPSEQAYIRQQPVYADSAEGGGGGLSSAGSAFTDRYGRQTGLYTKGVITAAGLTVDLPSPDSGIGADAVTPRDQTQLQQSFDYTDLCQAGILNDQRLAGGPQTSPGAGQNRSRPWHDFGRQNDADKIQIPKVFSSSGFKYHLETPISTSQRREDDRITYINKGQFYGITLDYIPEPDKQLKSQTVKSVVMLMFREEKSPEDEIKAWQFWHGRQHSVKQRILDADTKNSVGLVGCIEEVSHNAIAVYWNPLESSAKINVAVQCLSTDFSSQKGVKGLPLHIQVDTYEDPRDENVYHRGYCQIKVFCDKGAERKTRDEERRAAKRKMTATGRKKIDELYHPVVERSEFYCMSDLNKPPVLFSPAEDSLDKANMGDLQSYYTQEQEGGVGNGDSMGKQSPYLLHAKPATTPTLKFHNHFPPEPIDKKEGILDTGLTTDGTVFSPPMKRPKMMPGSHQERLMLYVRQDGDEVYTPLHVVPPTTHGLLNAIENKYKISGSNISNLYRKNRKGITVKIDDDMVRYYCNEDLFLMEIRQDPDDQEMIEITLVELIDR